MNDDFVRVRGMVTFARALGCLPLALTTFGIVIGWEAARGRSVSVFEVGLVLAMVIFWVYLAVRAMLLRVEVSADRLRVVQWYRSVAVPLSDIEAVFVAGYVGFLNWGGIGPSLGLSGTVQVSVREDSRSRLRWFNSTLALVSFADAKADRLRAAIAARGYAMGSDPPDNLT